MEQDGTIVISKAGHWEEVVIGFLPRTDKNNKEGIFIDPAFAAAKGRATRRGMRLGRTSQQFSQ
jgi:hypothetical protein